jgi:hypothetical protein
LSDDKSKSKATPSDEWEMPNIFVGEPILFYTSPGVKPEVAFVETVSDRSLSVRVISGYNRVGVHRDGVRHRDDPMLQFGEQRSEGFWDYTDFSKLVRSHLL